MSHSSVICYLKARFGIARKTLLLQLAMTVVKHSSPPFRIAPPSRAERRSKPGLVRWLDRHSDSLMAILWANPHFSFDIGDPSKSRFHYSFISPP
jgi:hypothetical protein